MSAPNGAPFAKRVDDALRHLQAILLGAVETPSLAPGLLVDALAFARGFRETAVEPEAARTVTAARPIALALSVEEAEAYADVLRAASRGLVLVAPTPTQCAALLVTSLRLCSQIDQHAGRPVAAPPPADAALSSGDAA